MAYKYELNTASAMLYVDSFGPVDKLSNQKIRDETDRLGSKYEFPDDGALLQLIEDLDALNCCYWSNVTFEVGKIVVPKDLAPWKKTKGELSRLAESVQELEKRLIGAWTDPVQRAALQQAFDPEVDEFDPDSTMPFVLHLKAYRDVIERAASFNSSAGQRPNADWHALAAEVCRNFWIEHKDKEAKGYFSKVSKPKPSEPVGNETTEPGNEFSKWFCEVMYAVSGATVSQCETALKKTPPPKNYLWDLLLE